MSEPTPSYKFPEADEFGAMCIKKFYHIPKTGKPTPDQWTVLTSIIQYDSNTKESKIVAQGTGTKCIGHSQLCPDGIVLNDSHAEVMARRAFLRYIYVQFFKNESIFLIDKFTNRFRLKEGITFHFFSTHLPCGDASILEDPIIIKKEVDMDENVYDDINFDPSNIKLEPGTVKIEPGIIKVEPGLIKTEFIKCENGKIKLEYIKTENGKRIKLEPGTVKVEQLTVKIEPGSIKRSGSAESGTAEDTNSPGESQNDEDDADKESAEPKSVEARNPSTESQYDDKDDSDKESAEPDTPEARNSPIRPQSEKDEANAKSAEPETGEATNTPIESQNDKNGGNKESAEPETAEARSPPIEPPNNRDDVNKESIEPETVEARKPSPIEPQDDKNNANKESAESETVETGNPSIEPQNHKDDARNVSAEPETDEARNPSIASKNDKDDPNKESAEPELVEAKKPPTTRKNDQDHPNKEFAEPEAVEARKRPTTRKNDQDDPNKEFAKPKPVEFRKPPTKRKNDRDNANKVSAKTTKPTNPPVEPQNPKTGNEPPEIIFYNQDPNDIGPQLPIIYTGAKILGQDVPDPMEQTQGCLRLKPGRGIRTLSMSCSDKISRWNILGIQGALLDTLLFEPIYIKTYNFCGQFKETAVRRAIYKRWGDKTFRNRRYTFQKPIVRGCSSEVTFKFAYNPTKQPSPGSLAWVAANQVASEIAVCGYRQGLTKKALNAKLGGLQISKAALFAEYNRVIKKYPEIIRPLTPEDIEKMTYLEAKHLAKDYQKAWKIVKERLFRGWTKKPDFLLDFKLPIKKYINS